MNKINSLYSSFLNKLKIDDSYRILADLDITNVRDVYFQNKKYINLSSNDYLGLRKNNSLISGSSFWLKKHGTGLGSSRLLVGNISAISKIEKKIALWKKFDSALIMNSGFQANVGVLSSLFDRKVLGSEPLVFADKMVHASTHYGCSVARIKQIRFFHNDMNHLESLLEKHSSSERCKFILVESVYSMCGDTSPMDKLYELRNKFNAFLIVDEAHSSGILGQFGSGIAEKADLVIGTFGKAMGGYGSYVACSNELREYLINKCGTFIYTTSLPPSVLGSIDASLDIVPKMDKEREFVKKLSIFFREKIKEQGFYYTDSNTHIIPLVIGNLAKGKKIVELLRRSGIWVKLILPPTVPKEKICLRFSLCTFHNFDDINFIFDILKYINKKS